MLRHLRRQRESAPWSGERALIGRWSVCSSRCPLDHPQASPAHNDKRHSILPEGPACLSLPPSSPFTLRFRRRFLSRGTVCYCMYHNARLFAGVSCVCIRAIPAGFHHPGDPRYRPGSGADTCDTYATFYHQSNSLIFDLSACTA